MRAYQSLHITAPRNGGIIIPWKLWFLVHASSVSKMAILSYKVIRIPILPYIEVSF